jgi:hypothetical protein
MKLGIRLHGFRLSRRYVHGAGVLVKHEQTPFLFVESQAHRRETGSNRRLVNHLHGA